MTRCIFIKVLLCFFTCNHGRMQDLTRGGTTFFESLGELYAAKRHVASGRPTRLLGGSGHAPLRKVFKWCNLVHFRVYFDKIFT